jgi:hypothetical protein
LEKIGGNAAFLRRFGRERLSGEGQVFGLSYNCQASSIAELIGEKAWQLKPHPKVQGSVLNGQGKQRILL